MKDPRDLPLTEPSSEQESLSLDQVVAKYGRLAQGIANQYKNRGVPSEDLRQEALLGLIHAARHFQPDKGAQFSTYAVFWIKKQVLLALQKESKSFSETGISDPEALAALPDPRPAPAQDSDLILPEGLPPLERRVLLLSCRENLTLKEIARELDTSVERVKQLRGKALRRIRKTPKA